MGSIFEFIGNTVGRYFVEILAILTLLSGVIMLIGQRTNRFWQSCYRNAKSFFPILLVVFILRAFIVQPYVVPTGSLAPSIQPVEFILLGMYNYGLRLPFTHQKVINIAEPKKGDIAQFYYPEDHNTLYIKRVIGVPGDTVAYVNKTLYINGQKIEQRYLETVMDRSNPEQPPQRADVFEEDLFGVKHKIYQYPSHMNQDFVVMSDGKVRALLSTENPEKLSPEGLVIPPGKYFMLGDNRDDSKDSRYWGFVDESELIGKGLFVLMSWDRTDSRVRWSRIGTRL
jgi:signal peptidase I